MGRHLESQCKLCRAENTKLFLKGERCLGGKCPITKRRPGPGKGPRSRQKKVSDYGLQLREKQKLKRMYGMFEKQFGLTFERAAHLPGKTGDNLIIMLERRLDNVVYRMHFSSSRKQARQLISHGHILLNGKKVSIGSYITKENDVIAVKENSKKLTTIKESLKEYTRSGTSLWLEVDPDNMRGKIRSLPKRSDLTDLTDIKEQLIVELYSR